MTKENRAELNALYTKFKTLLQEMGHNESCPSPDYKHIQEILGDHPEFARWKELHSEDVMGGFRRWGRY